MHASIGVHRTQSVGANAIPFEMLQKRDYAVHFRAQVEFLRESLHLATANVKGRRRSIVRRRFRDGSAAVRLFGDLNAATDFAEGESCFEFEEMTGASAHDLVADV